jgi:hypothetical protein
MWIEKGIKGGRSFRIVKKSLREYWGDFRERETLIVGESSIKILRRIWEN